MPGVVRKSTSPRLSRHSPSTSPRPPRHSPRSRSSWAPSVVANLPGRLPKGKISPTSYVPPRPRFPEVNAGSDESPSSPAFARSSRSPKGRKSRERHKPHKVHGSRESPTSPKGHGLAAGSASRKAESLKWYESSGGSAFTDGSPRSPAGTGGALPPTRRPCSPGSSSPNGRSRFHAHSAGSGGFGPKAERPALRIEEPTAPVKPSRIWALYRRLKGRLKGVLVSWRSGQASPESCRSPARTAPNLNLEPDAVLPEFWSAESVSSSPQQRFLRQKFRTVSTTTPPTLQITAVTRGC